MVSFPGLKKDLCGALKKAMGMECRGQHIPAVPQWLPSLHSHTAPIYFISIICIYFKRQF